MAPNDERSYIYRHPVRSMVLAAIVLAVTGIILTLTVVGSILGVPLLVLALFFAAGAYFKHRRSPAST
jgi:hypothetical protein